MAAPHSGDDDLATRKQAARRHALQARAAHTAIRAAAGAAVAGADLARHVLAALPPPPDAAVSGFWPMGDEIDIRPLLLALHARGHVVLLPVTPRRGQPLEFRAWIPGAPMQAERFGTQCPMPDAPAGVPDVLFVPLLAFDRKGRRLGYGGGFYDRTLARLPSARAIGCAYAAQELDEVPAGEYDRRLPAIATERGVIVCDLS